MCLYENRMAQKFASTAAVNIAPTYNDEMVKLRNEDIERLSLRQLNLTRMECRQYVFKQTKYYYLLVSW